MAEKKAVKEITSMEEDFAQWYTDVVVKAELTGYTSVKGFMVLKPMHAKEPTKIKVKSQVQVLK